MNHPVEVLAAYVDASLTSSERMAVDEHLSACDRCRAEVAQAMGARRHLREMPDVVVPSDLGGPAMKEWAKATPRSGQPRWTKVVPFAAAAAIVGLLAITLPRIGGSADDASSAAGPADSEAAIDPPKDLRLEVVDTDFDSAALQDEASDFAARRGAAQGAGEIAGDALFASPPPSVRLADRSRTSQALQCLRTAFAGHPGRPIRLVQAAFQGTPAYLAYVVEGPGAGQAPDTLSIWVADRRACSVLSLTAARL